MKRHTAIGNRLQWNCFTVQSTQMAFGSFWVFVCVLIWHCLISTGALHSMLSISFRNILKFHSANLFQHFLQLFMQKWIEFLNYELLQRNLSTSRRFESFEIRNNLKLAFGWNSIRITKSNKAKVQRWLSHSLGYQRGDNKPTPLRGLLGKHCRSKLTTLQR